MVYMSLGISYGRGGPYYVFGRIFLPLLGIERTTRWMIDLRARARFQTVGADSIQR
jgi:hypothetical protein